MSAIKRWYELRRAGREVNSEQSKERTDFVDGANRTITFFPSSAFLTYEQKSEYHHQRSP